MKIAIYPGTFDPVTNGHIDIINRAAAIFPKVIVSVAHNIRKEPLFNVDERMEMLEEIVRPLDNVDIDHFRGLLIHYAEKKKAEVIIRGLRAVSDFEYEFQMALMNRSLAEKIITIFLMPNEKYSYLNSSIVKEVARCGGDVSAYVPKIVEKKLKERLKDYGFDCGHSEQGK